MIDGTQSKTLTPFPRAKIERVVQEVLPKGQSFELQTEDSGINEKKVVRIITPAWRRLQNSDRINRVLKALDGQLTDSQQDRILRLSVLTPKEYQDLGLGMGGRGSSGAARRTSSSKTTGAKPKVSRQPKPAFSK